MAVRVNSRKLSSSLHPRGYSHRSEGNEERERIVAKIGFDLPITPAHPYPPIRHLKENTND